MLIDSSGLEDGWPGTRPHHQVVTGTLCGSWFGDAPDEDDVPHATMSDGTPRGYLEMEFGGTRYRMDGYKSLGRPREYQMHLELPPGPSRAALAGTNLTVNVSNGSERSILRWRCGAGDTWRPLGRLEAAEPRSTPPPDVGAYGVGEHPGPSVTHPVMNPQLDHECCRRVSLASDLS
ncbi:MAG: calcineurin-like phosphoesterase C-terminal domain-containing protein [Verrucomicrobia bacterium]|nr:calcineurin-like phosphoesterase C-terminal domain-containing protein [Verrucomicrobiota bacterium]